MKFTLAMLFVAMDEYKAEVEAGLLLPWDWQLQSALLPSWDLPSLLQLHLHAQ